MYYRERHGGNPQKSDGDHNHGHFKLKLNIYLAAGIDPGAAYAATCSVWGDHRTAVTVPAVTPARPGALVEIEAVAMLTEY